MGPSLRMLPTLPLPPKGRPTQPPSLCICRLHFLCDGRVYIAMSRRVTPVPRYHVAARWALDFAPCCVLSRVSSAAAAVLTSPVAALRCSDRPPRWHRPRCGGRWKPCAMPPRERRVGTYRGRRAGRRCCSPPTRCARGWNESMFLLGRQIQTTGAHRMFGHNGAVCKSTRTTAVVYRS